MANGESSRPGHWVGVDLGGTKIQAAVYDQAFQVLGRERKRTKGFEGTESVVRRMIRCVGSAIEDAGVPLKKIEGIGVGCPGPVDPEQGVVLEAVNLGWENVPLAERLQDEFGCPVLLANDVDAGLYGEYRFGAARGARTALGLFPGTGIGGSCVYDGAIVRGRNLTCMEIGHIKVTERGRLCGCGGHGCLETEASRLAIATEVLAAAYRGEAPSIIELAGTDLANIRSGVLAKAIRQGETVVEEIVRRAASLLGRTVGNLIPLLGPDTIVLGGGLVEAMPELYLEAVTEAARENVMSSFLDSFRVVAAKLGDDAGCLGSASWVESQVRS